jgi:hypothetical protein
LLIAAIAKIGNQEPTTKDTKKHGGEIAKIAGLPPQQAKVGLAGGPGIAKIGN